MRIDKTNRMNKKSNKKIVWQFTNKRKLNAQEFLRYFEKKVKKTIRKYKMPISKINKKTLKATIIDKIIKELPLRKGKLSDESLDDISNSILYIIMHGKSEDLRKLLPRNQPLYFLSDKEIELYARLKKIKGNVERAKGKLREIDNFISIIEKKNPDIRHNIVEALLRSELE